MVRKVIINICNVHNPNPNYNLNSGSFLAPRGLMCGALDRRHDFNQN